MLRHSRALAFGLILAFVFLGCARTPQSGVSLKAVPADLVFGIPPVQEPVAPPNTQLLPDNPIPVVGIGGRPRFTPPPVTEECPQASPTTFPKEEATVGVSGEIRGGTYRWVVDGTQILETGDTYYFPRFVQRTLSEPLKEEASDEYRFSTRESELVFGSDKTVYQTYKVVPDDGIYLVEIRVERGDGTRETFTPRPEILFMPLPVFPGDEVSTVGVDPTTQEVLEHTGKVVGRKRIDACGSVIDSWFVEGEQNFTSVLGDDYLRKYDYAIATQLGGQIIYEHVENPKEDPKFKLDARLGEAR